LSRSPLFKSWKPPTIYNSLTPSAVSKLVISYVSP